MRNNRLTIAKRITMIFAAGLTFSAAGQSGTGGVSTPAETIVPQFHYSYFKELIPFTLDVARVAVLQRESSAVTDPAGAFEAAGIATVNLAPGPLREWSISTTRVDDQSLDGIRDIVRRLADGGAVDFASPVFRDDRGPVIITPQILVGFQDGVPAARATSILNSVGAGTVLEANYARMSNVYRIQSDSRDGFRVLDTTNALARLAEVKFAEPDMLRTAQLLHIPNDPLFPRQWGLHNTGQNIFQDADVMCCSVPCTGDCWPPCPQYCLGAPCDGFPGGLPDFDVDAPEAWDLQTGDPAIIVAVFDQGIEFDHPDLMIDPSLGADFTGEGGGGFPMRSCDWHGTAMAGIICARVDNGIGVSGLAPGVSVASARVLQSTSTTIPCGSGATWSHLGIIEALRWAEEDIGAVITNHSYGIGESAALTTKLADTRARGMLHFAAAGNTGNTNISYPARLNSVLAVSAVEPFGTFWPSSNFGPQVDFSAPGAYIYSTDLTQGNIDGFGASICNDYFPYLGTSNSSPVAAAVAALVLSEDPTLTATEVEQIMRLSAADLGSAGHDQLYGWGMVNAFGAVQLAHTCRGDLNRDGAVNLNDLTTLLAHYGMTHGAARADGDVDSDGAVNLNDLSNLLSSFGAICS